MKMQTDLGAFVCFKAGVHNKALASPWEAPYVNADKGGFLREKASLFQEDIHRLNSRYLIFIWRYARFLKLCQQLLSKIAQYLTLLALISGIVLRLFSEINLLDTALFVILVYVRC